MLEFFTIYCDIDGGNRSIVASLLAVVAMVVGALAVCKLVLLAAEWYAARIRNSMKVGDGNSISTTSSQGRANTPSSNDGEVDVGTTHVAAIKQPTPTVVHTPKPSLATPPAAPVEVSKKKPDVVKEEIKAPTPAANPSTKPTPKVAAVVAKDIDDMDALLDSALDQTLEHDALLEDALLEADVPVRVRQPESESSEEEEEEEEGSDGLMDAAFDELDEADTLLDEALMDVQSGKAPAAAPKKVAPTKAIIDEEEEDGLIAEMRRKKEAKRKAAASKATN